MASVRVSRGFTLIELLTVIAIIAILAGITAAALPRVLERAKIARVEATAQSLHKSMVSYYTQHSSYPPAYGFRKWESREKTNFSASDFFLRGHLALMNLAQSSDVYDEFSEGFGYDADRDGTLEPMEFLPIGLKDQITNRIVFDESARFNGNNMVPEVAEQLRAELRPFVYAPINKLQFDKARQFWLSTNDFMARNWDRNNDLIRQIKFPPSEYDAYVLISVGPAADTFGVVADPTGNEPLEDLYHILALRTYFLATRDLNGNLQPDLEFRARTRQGEGDLTYTFNGNAIQQYLPIPGAPTNQLPSQTAPNGAGPLVFAF